jgi:isopentenyl-diphosphate Delta-isomerase
MNESTNTRKMQHIDIVSQDDEIDRRKNYFDRIFLKHRALPEIDLEEVDTSVIFLGKQLTAPILISSMTGGDYTLLRKINKNLALAAEATGVAMAVGSQRVLFTHPEARSSFELRPFAPNTLLFANLGAVQLNYGFALEQCRTAIEVLQADGLYFHLNPLQEAVQPEGNVNFSGLVEKIGTINQKLNKPVILKEVGAGLSDMDVELGLQHGLHYFDVSGSGGTSWSRIEHFRDERGTNQNTGLLFQDWGIPTPIALQMLKPYHDRITLIASGGVRSGIDVIKCMILGASLVGLASPFLQPAMESSDKVIEVINRLKHEIKIGMFLMGVSKTSLLLFNDQLVMDSK